MKLKYNNYLKNPKFYIISFTKHLKHIITIKIVYADVITTIHFVCHNSIECVLSSSCPVCNST